MIDRTSLPSISDILRLLGVQPKGRRSKCPVHRGDNPQALSFNDEAGVWCCHRCAKGGDVITLVMLSLDTDFAGALRFLGIAPGKPPQPDPKTIEQARTREALRLVVTNKAKKLRKAYCDRWEFERASMARLLNDPEDPVGWELLKQAYWNEARDEEILGRVDMCKTDEEFVEAFKTLSQLED